MSRALLVLVALLLVLFVGPREILFAAEPADSGEAAADAKATAQFMRLVSSDSGDPQRLETSIVRFKSATGEGDVAIDLVSAVHVGDKAYYETLNKEFEQYDVVLYELVAPKGTRIPKGGRESDNPLAFLQSMTKSMLELDSQTDCIDYTKENFVHADLSPDEMAEAMKERGENGLTLVLGATADMIRQANLEELRREREGVKIDEPAEEDPLAMLFDPQRATKLKRQMARAFANPETLDGGLGPTLGRLLVEDRNVAALKELQKQLTAGKKKIAIFYGAAHMPDFQKRLEADFGMKVIETRWVSAWDLKPGNMGPAADPLDLFRKLLEDAAQ